MVEHNHDMLLISFDEYCPTLYLATVTIPKSLVDAVYLQAIFSQQNALQAPGFQKDHIPTQYIEEVCQTDLTEHLKEFLLNYFVASFLYQEIKKQKIRIAGSPRLTNVYTKPHADAQFTFELTIAPPVSFKDWKYFLFKAPKRKNYKDLDRQVESFLKEEKDRLNSCSDKTISLGDWVHFRITLVSSDHQLILGLHSEYLWYKVGDEEADNELRNFFMNKKIGDTFYTDYADFQQYFSTYLDTRYTFKIDIIDILENAFFCFEHFKKHFKLKTNKAITHKMIEVFSYRNDLSQRRTTVEESLRLFAQKHPFDIPEHLILRQQQAVLNDLQTNPDFHVYRMQHDFSRRVRQLAEKQIREMILIDQLSYYEDIDASVEDIKCYLNLTKRPRSKEFIYFETPETKLMGQELPIAHQELNYTCLREKTLNHIIYHLTK